MGRLIDWVMGGDLIKREEPEPLEGTRMDLFNSIIPSWYAEQMGNYWGDAALTERVWIASSCLHKNSNQIRTMPIEYHGPFEPKWVSAPDSNIFPNGIGDAMYAIVSQIYGWGFTCLWVTDRYASGFPRTWTVLPSASLTITIEDGRRVYRQGAGSDPLDASRIVQIDRNPTTAPHGTSALRAYSQLAYGLLAAGNQAMTVNNGGIPGAYMKPQKKQTREQAEALQAAWAAAVTRRNGALPVVPFDIDIMELSINPSDLSLIEGQQWNAMMICNAFGMPSVLMNMALAGGLTYQNPAALGEFWWRFELRNTATGIANAFSAQMLPAGQWITIDAADTFAEITDLSDDDDEQLSQVAKASPAQQQNGSLTAIGGNE